MSGVFVTKKWRWARRFTQIAMFLTILAAPFLGGWQRLERNYLSTWDGHGWDLPAALTDALPRGETPRDVYDANQLLGGGAVTSLFGVPAADPLASVVALTAEPSTGLLWLVFALPLVFALFAGRAFCGWLCPFGTLSRLVDRVTRAVPWLRDRKRYKVPARRPVRWVVLGVSLLAAVAGFQLFLYLVLPHVVLQQSMYAMWLMGGGGAALGWILGLLVAGVVFGPTVYCATLCPTGAALSVLGRARRLRIHIDDTVACGNCNLCTKVCWLHLDPASGDPGPDCDACARCFDICPRANLRVGLSPGKIKEERPKKRKGKAKAAAALIAMLFGSAALFSPTTAYAEARGQDPLRPTVLMHLTDKDEDRSLVVSVVDLTGVRDDADDITELFGAEITVFMARGKRGPPDALGRMQTRDVYRGPMTVVVTPWDGEAAMRYEMKQPNSPSSTGRATIYRQITPLQLQAGDRVSIEPIAGWLPQGKEFTVPQGSPGVGWGRTLGPFGVALLVFGGLMLLVFAVGPGKPVAASSTAGASTKPKS